MYLLVAVVVTVIVIALAWRGLGARIEAEERGSDSFGGGPPPRTTPPRRPTRTVAPDDDPDFLREIDRKLKDGRESDPGSSGAAPV